MALPLSECDVWPAASLRYLPLPPPKSSWKGLHFLNQSSLQNHQKKKGIKDSIFRLKILS